MQNLIKQDEEEKCSICLNEFTSSDFDIIRLFKCKDHFFHESCIQNILTSGKKGFKCPGCQQEYGEFIGDMPPGKMSTKIVKQRCNGYQCDTIEIKYQFKSGTLPNGISYSGTVRTAFLPNNQEGQEVLHLLQRAFDKKFTFVIGTSLTTGAQNAIV